MTEPAAPLPYARALITGIGGQDGALLAHHLLAAGVEVDGTYRPGGATPAWRLAELRIGAEPRLHLHALDLADAAAVRGLVAATRPQAIFHLAGQSRVADSFADPLASIAANGGSTLHLLEALRAEAADAHLVLAASAEIFGRPAASLLDETTPPAPATPYGVSKLLAHAAVGAWRASYGLRASSAILFNHESEWRDEAFVTRKLTRAVARIALGRQDRVLLGNLDAARDFGYAPEYVAALARLAALPAGEDVVLATGRAATIRDFATQAFAAADIALTWHGRGADETAVDADGRVRVGIDPALLRPVDAPVLAGDATKARRLLGFAPQVDLAELTRRMVAADIEREQRA